MVGVLMTNFDIEYLKLCKKILKEGIEVENRTGVNTIKIPSYNFEFDLSKEFPILTTKQTFYRQAIIELLWIWQVGSNDVRWLQDRNVHIWDEWEVDEDGIYRIYEPNTLNYDKDKEVIVYDPMSLPVTDPFGKTHEMKPKMENGKVLMAKSKIEGKNIRMAKYYEKKFAHTIGTAYGYITNRYDFTNNLIETIRKDKNDRRMVKSMWQDEYLRGAVLPSCVWSTEWDVTGNRLNLHVHQRSCDVALGLPFNVTQYATFLKMIAQVTGLEAGSISYSIKDAHIYMNQIEGIKKQISREKLYNELSMNTIPVLQSRKDDLENKLNYLSKEDDLYKEIDTELKIIDMLLYPTKPILELDKSIHEFKDFDNSKDIKHVKIKNYKHMGSIKFKVTQ